MTLDQFIAYSRYLRELADLLGLKDWQIELKREFDADDTTAASCTCTYGQKHAYVYFGQGFFTHTPEWRRYFCVHELLHAHAHPLQVVLHNLAGRLGSEAYSIVNGCHEDALEHCIDGIGWAVSRLLPLPPAVPAVRDEPLRLVA